MSLEDYVSRFENLGVNRSQGYPKPHKMCMLLAVLDLAEHGALDDDNKIFYAATIEPFNAYFAIVRRPGDYRRPYYPFEWLKSDGFWHLELRQGQGLTVQDGEWGSHKAVRENIEFARLEPELYRLFLESDKRDELRTALIEKWFPDHKEALWNRIEQNRLSGEYERALRQTGPDQSILIPDAMPDDKSVRDSAFRRLVLEAYDYRCAASGWRLKIPDVHVLIDAAHLIPFKKTQDNRPDNGIALTPTYHRALDAHLIAPGPDMRWHVSKILDSRIRDHDLLRALDGEIVICQGKRGYKPRREALEWRVDNLLRPP